MSVLFDERAEQHAPYFDTDGKIVPSVTTVIGRNLGWDSKKLHGWIARMTLDGYDHAALTRVSAEVGTCCHQMVERFLDPDIDPLDPVSWSPKVWDHAVNGLTSFTKWYDKHEVESLFTETRMVHPKLNYGGTLDFGCKLFGDEALVDFKTSDRVRRGHIIQVSAYQELWRVNLHTGPPVYILKLNARTGEMAELTDVSSSMELGLRVFRSLMGLDALKREWEHGLDDRLASLL